MRKAFLEFLERSGTIPADRVAELGRLLHGVPDPIGRIAFGYGMITGADIDRILDEQRRDGRPFGEIATSLGMLTHQQVENLLRVQRLRNICEVAEALGLSNVCPLDVAVVQLGQFIVESHRFETCEADR